MIIIRTDTAPKVTSRQRRLVIIIIIITARKRSFPEGIVFGRVCIFFFCLFICVVVGAL